MDARNPFRCFILKFKLTCKNVVQPSCQCNNVTDAYVVNNPKQEMSTTVYWWIQQAWRAFPACFIFLVFYPFSTHVLRLAGICVGSSWKSGQSEHGIWQQQPAIGAEKNMTQDAPGGALGKQNKATLICFPNYPTQRHTFASLVFCES